MAHPDPQIEQVFKDAAEEVRREGYHAPDKALILTGLSYIGGMQADMSAAFKGFVEEFAHHERKMEAGLTGRKRRVRSNAMLTGLGAVIMGSLLALTEWAKKTWGN